ncbi:hypothetical protein VaNZ11_012255 [Volvox africanus]|uniref:Protein kinase domain-containing protein n=1 Tax=Volvox africanus TaxID=51714 RepID=A0ABQ5SEQ1_9CHLO|nr:hypothetical protein VaNZ11_012255 [Volvox africanus]
MPVWLQSFCGCIKPNVKEFSFNKGKDVCLNDGGPEGVDTRKLWGKSRPCTLAKGNELLPAISDQVSGTIIDDISDVHVRGPPTASVAWRRSSSNADTLAPLAEDETLAPLEKRAFDEANRAESNEASRSSCPILVARGFSIGMSPELAAGGGQPAIRPHSHTAVPRNGICVSPVSAVTSRSLASPMRHDFMALMRQASNRGSSCGLAAESVGQVSPQPWSPGLATDGCRGVGLAGHVHPAEWVAAATAQQTIGSDALALAIPCYRRVRRASAFTVVGGGCGAHVRSVAANTSTREGSTAVYSPPCPLSAVTATATFARCSSSPDMRPGGLMLGPKCPGRSSGGAIEARLVQSPYTAPPSVRHQASSGAGCQSCDDGGGCSASGGSGGVLAPAMLRVLQPGPGRNGGLELRSVQTPSPSPLRPRDLPPPVPTATPGTTTAMAMAAVAGVAAVSVTGAHSASALPKYYCPAASSGLLRKRPASSASSRRGSYQQVRLLQQLKEQHELYLQQCTPAMAVDAAINAAAKAAAAKAAAAKAAAAKAVAATAVAATAVAATAVAATAVAATAVAAMVAGAPIEEATGQELQLLEGANGGKGIKAGNTIKWVEAYFSIESHSCANSCPEAGVVSSVVAEQLEMLPIEGSFAADAVDFPAAADARVNLDATTANAIRGAATCGGRHKCRKPPVPAVPRSPSVKKLSSTSAAISAPAPAGSCWTGQSRCFTASRVAGGKGGRGSGSGDGSWGVSAQDNVLLSAAAFHEEDGGSGVVEPAVEPSRNGSGTSDRNLSRCVVEEAIVVGSLGDTLSIATKEFGPAYMEPSSSQQQAMVNASIDTESQAMQVIQNLLLRNALPDNAQTVEPLPMEDASSTAGHGALLGPVVCGHRSSLSASLFEAFRSHQGALSEGFSSLEADVAGNNMASHQSRDVAAAAANGDDVEPPISWAAATAGGSRRAPAMQHGGCAADGSLGNEQGQSPFIPQSSITAIALLRSAAALNFPLPVDGSGACSERAGGTDCHFSVTHVGGTEGGATITGCEMVGLDTDGPSAAAIPAGSSFMGCVTSSTTIDPCLTTDTSRCAPLALLSSYAAWPSPALTSPLPRLPPAAAGQQPSPSSGRPSITLQTLPEPKTAVVQQTDSSSTYSSLRLEDGLVSDPLLLVDGLGQLSYVTSGAYAAVYQGTLEDIPVGIKFLASTSLDLSTPAVKEALLGPGLEHKHIIRTYTTRVARVDGRAVAQLKAVAAAMAAAAVMHHKRSSVGRRRYSSGATCSPLSVPPTASSTPPAAAGRPAVAHQQRCTRGMVTSPSPSGTADAASPGPIACLPPLASLPAVATTAANPCKNGGGGISGGSSNSTRVADGTGSHPHLPVQTFYAGPVINNTANGQRPVASSASCNAIFSDAMDVILSQPLDNSAAAGNNSNGIFASGSGVEQNHTSVEVATVLPPRQMYFRKSASANARAGNELVASDAGLLAVMEAAVPTQQLKPLQPLPVQLSSQHTVIEAADDTRSSLVLRAPMRRGSAHIPHMHGSYALLPLPQHPPPSQPLQPLPIAGPRTHTTAPVKRSGSAAERMLHVLSMLGVIGPTGQLTAEAHYVTAVVMEFADKGNLDSFSRSAAPCNLATAVDLLRQVARGMSYLHAHGLVHGDLKPANVLLMMDPSSGKLIAKVADFGLSGLSGQLGSNGGADTCGTVAYSAPERLAEEEGAAEQAADVYSFGICMQQLVSGVRPFAELTFGQVMFSVLCLKMRPSWPEGRCGALEPLYNMCCHSQPTKRPTFDQVVAWLDSLSPTAVT